MKASVIVVSWNGVSHLPACLGSLLQQDYPDFEVIVVDNGSTDGSPDLVAAQFPAVRLVRNEVNLGFAAGCNRGLETATGEVLVLLNQDTRVRPGWLSQLVRGVTSDPRVGIGGCKILYPDEQTIQHAGGVIRRPLALANHRGYRQPDDGRWDQKQEVDFVTGAAMAFRREVAEVIGLLDEGFCPAYYEDADYCARARAAGYSVTYFPNASLIHHEAASLGRESPAYLQHFHCGRLRFLLKHTHPAAFLSEVLPPELEWLRSLAAPEERLALWHAYRRAAEHFAQLVQTDLFVSASRAEWLAVQDRIGLALDELREAVFQGKAAPQAVPEEPALWADFHRDRLRGTLRETVPSALITDLIPAERARWAADDPPAQQILAGLYRELAPHLTSLLPAAYPGESLLAEVAWKEQLAHRAEDPSGWLPEIRRLRDRLTALEQRRLLSEYTFVSHAPVVGPLLARLRALWYGVAARWAVGALADQQQTFNTEVQQALCEMKEILDSIERTAIENDRAVTQLQRRVAALERGRPGTSK